MSIENTDEESFTPEQTDQPEQRRKRPEADAGLDLDLHFLPAWAQQGANAKLYENFTGDEGGDRRERRGGGGPRRDFGGGGGNRDRGPRRDRPRPEGGRPGFGGGGRPGFGQGGGGPQGQQRPGGGPRGDRREGGRFGRGGPRRDQRDQGGRPPEDRPQIKLPDLEVSFIPEDKGVESLARQIKLSGRAYPLFEIAYLVLKKPERYHVHLSSKKKEDGTPVQPLLICALDDTLWLDENEAMQHVLDKHFGTFYASEKIPTDPPKGVYTFVAQCGMSGTILGPPNYHDYQNKLRKLHQERFARMPFDMFKSRIRIVKDEAVVKKWLEEQSFRTEYTALNVPETIKFNSRDEVERHFRETHLANVIKSVDTFTLAGTDVADVQNRGLQALMRRSYDEQMRFPLKVVNVLSGQFARQGLQFFKVNKSVTHVAVARPHYLDMEATPVSEGVKKIVDFVNASPRSTRKKLLEALAPGSSLEPAAAPASPAEGQPAEAAAAPPAAPSAAQAVISDLHWLIHQGHVIEFANGILETAKKPLPRPPRPERQPKPGQPAEQQPAEGEVTTQEGVVAGEGAAAETAGAPATDQPAETATVQDESGASAGADVSTAGTTSPEPVADANKT
jgi:hypothetical protein